MRCTSDRRPFRKSQTYVMKDVRASVCKVRAAKARSKYAGILSTARSTESVADKLARDGSNSIVGAAERGDAGGESGAGGLVLQVP